MTDSLQSNKALVTKFIGLMGTPGRQPEALELIDPEASWWTARGNMKPADILNVAQGVLPLLEAPLKMDIGVLTAEDDRVAMEAHCTGKRKNGQIYDNNYHFLFRIRDGRIIEVREHQDTAHVDKVWSDLF